MKTLQRLKTLDRIKAKTREFQADLERKEITVDVQERVPISVLQEAAKKVAPRVREALVANLAASGIKRQKGNDHIGLHNAVANSAVWYEDGRIKYDFPPGKEERLYVAGNALNYGAVRQPQVDRAVDDVFMPPKAKRKKLRGVLGERSARKLKNQLQGRAGKSSRARSWGSGRTNRARSVASHYSPANARTNRGGKSVRVSLSYGGKNGKQKTGHMTVVYGKFYFRINAGQLKSIRDAFAARVKEIMAQRAKRRR